MIPETGSPKEFKQAVLQEVELAKCLVCEKPIVRDPVHPGMDICDGCVVTTQVRLGPEGVVRTIRSIDVSNLTAVNAKALIARWQKALRR
jgi:hypothetical protein